MVSNVTGIGMVLCSWGLLRFLVIAEADGARLDSGHVFSCDSSSIRDNVGRSVGRSVSRSVGPSVGRSVGDQRVSKLVILL